MTTRVVAVTNAVRNTTTATVTTDRNGTTTIRSKSTDVRSSNILHYLVCDDRKNHSPFVNPRETSNKKKTKNPPLHSEDVIGTTQEPGKSSWPSRSTTPSWILRSIALFDTVFVSWWIMHALCVYHEKIPLSIKRKIVFAAWEWYVWIHTIVACQWMGCYADQSFYTGQTNNSDKDPDDDDATISDEFKAFSTLMYPIQFFPVDIPRMRFSLSQLNSISIQEVPLEDSIERIECAVAIRESTHATEQTVFIVPESQRDHQTVSGLYVTNNKNNNSSTQNKNKTEPTSSSGCGSKPKKTILFWIYGGAYLAGDAEGNLSLANEFVIDCDADAVFIPSYRLAPEASIDDVLWDICWSYRHLLLKLENDNSDDEAALEIVMVGISSGGALALRLLQFIRDRSSKLMLMPSFLEPLIDDIVAISARSSTTIAGSVLFAPYVDYRDPQPPDGSFLRNAKFDWVVTEAVQHYGLPYLNGFIPPLGDDLQLGSTSSASSTSSTSNNTTKNTNGRIQYSPLSHEMNNLPPLCLIASEHEACYDMTIEIVNKARGDNCNNTRSSSSTNDDNNTGAAVVRPTDVTIGVWKHVCHVFSMMQAFLPEGKASIEFSKEWIRTKTSNP